MILHDCDCFLYFWRGGWRVALPGNGRAFSHFGGGSRLRKVRLQLMGKTSPTAGDFSQEEKQRLCSLDCGWGGNDSTVDKKSGLPNGFLDGGGKSGQPCLPLPTVGACLIDAAGQVIYRIL